MTNRIDPVHVLSLGGGVQSTTIAMMAAHGLITPMPVKAIFADTQAEPRHVYEQLGWVARNVPFPLEVVTAGSLTQYALSQSRHKTKLDLYANRVLPVFYEVNGTTQIGSRRCTQRFKIHPIRKATREYFKRGVVQWIGISTDEATRMRDADVKYVTNRWPLIELGMNRQDCINWLLDHGYPEPRKTSCVYCPYHNDATWLDIKRQDPWEFARAVTFEKQLQAAELQHDREPYTPYLHRSLKPLDQVEFKHEHQTNLFENECFGYCEG